MWGQYIFGTSVYSGSVTGRLDWNTPPMEEGMRKRVLRIMNGKGIGEGWGGIFKENQILTDVISGVIVLASTKTLTPNEDPHSYATWHRINYNLPAHRVLCLNTNRLMLEQGISIFYQESWKMLTTAHLSLLLQVLYDDCLQCERVYGLAIFGLPLFNSCLYFCVFYVSKLCYTLQVSRILKKVLCVTDRRKLIPFRLWFVHPMSCLPLLSLVF